MRAEGEIAGTYRLYGWNNAQAIDFDESRTRHAGLGISIDQRVGAQWNLFGRYGRRTSGRGSFDQALTVGFEHAGHRWGRANDAIGVALGRLSTDDARFAAVPDPATAGSAAAGAEKIIEIFYRYALSDGIEISPDFQIVRRPGGDAASPSVRAFGLRARIAF